VLGEVLADVSILNPTIIVGGGPLARAGEHLIYHPRDDLPALHAARDRRVGIHIARSDDRVGILVAGQLVGLVKLRSAVIGQTLAQVVR
jgi:hypothetical protein